MSAEKKTRNQKLLEDYHSKKYTLADLIKKYNLSQTRIYQIVYREASREKESNGK